MSYNSDILIKTGCSPPPQIYTQNNPNIQQRHIMYQSNVSESDIFTNNPYPNSFHSKPIPLVNPTYNQHIIKPPKENVTHGSIYDTEVICSEDRDYTIYPDPSRYVIKLKDIYKNVTAVTLFNACIPNSSYIINQNNNKIYFRETCEIYIAEIPVGDYTIDELCTVIGETMTEVSKNNNSNFSTYTASYDNITGKVCISSDLKGGEHIFSLDFCGPSENFNGKKRNTYPSKSIGKVIGFSRKHFLYAAGLSNITFNSTTIYGNEKSEFTKDFKPGDIFFVEQCDQIFTVNSVINDTILTVNETPLNNCYNVQLAKGKHCASNKYDLRPDCFIVLHILELENIRSNISSIDRSFVTIPMISSEKNFLISSTSGTPSYVKYFNPPLSRLDRLTICFKDKNGNIIDFNGLEHYLEFHIHTLNAPGKYVPGAI